MKKKYQLSYGILKAWRYSITHWRLLFVLYLCNTLFAFLLITPIKSAIENSLLNRQTPDQISFTFLSDLVSHQTVLLSSQFTLLGLGGLIYLLWLIFATAGITHYISQIKFTFIDFLKGALVHFWQFFRLALYTLIIIVVILLTALTFYNLGDTNIFSIESEEIFIIRASIIIPIITILYTLVKLWNDLLKLKIVNSQEKGWFFKSALTSWKNIFNARLILVFITNILIALILVGVLASIKSMNFHYMITLLISQLMLIVRIAYKIANLKNIHDLVD